MKKPISYFVLIFSLLSFNLNGQQSLELTSCEAVEYAVNDHSDSDGDGNVCETIVILSNSAQYSGNENCQLSDINWEVIVDLNADGVDDLEYRSDLPSNDNVLDDTNGNGIPDMYIPPTTNNEIQNIELPDIEGAMSNHSVIWKVTDACDLGNLCLTNFTVADKKPPSPFCVSLSSLIFDDYLMEIYAEDFNVGVFDNCTDQENIRFSFSGDSIVPTRRITCDDLHNSPINLNIYFWDESDNINFCVVFVSVLPGMVDCFPGGDIKGVVTDWKGNPLEGVEVLLEANLPEYPRSEITDAEGEYNFGYHEDYFEYKLSASYDDNFISGVSTLDLVLIVRHLLGLQPFLNPYQIIAADINGDNAIKANDLFTLRKLILGIETDISTNTSWRFIRSDFQFIDPLNPFLSLSNSNEDPYVYGFDNIDNEGYNFIGIKTGDLNE